MHQYRNSISKSNRTFCPSKIFLWQRQEKKLPFWSRQITNRDALSLQIPEWHECFVSPVPQKTHFLFSSPSERWKQTDSHFEWNFRLTSHELLVTSYLSLTKCAIHIVNLWITASTFHIFNNNIYFYADQNTWKKMTMRPDNSDDESDLTAFN